jgi:hypothetical protein
MGKGTPIPQMSKIELGEPPTEISPQLIALAALLEIANSGKRLQRLRAIKALLDYAARQPAEPPPK